MASLGMCVELVGCGGGGSDSNATSAPTPPVSVSRSLQGVAAKGLIKNGIVKVFAIAADGSVATTAIFTGRTSTVDGSYNINLGGNLGSYMIEVTGDKDSLMSDEISGDIAIPANFVLRSLIKVEDASGNTISGHVTPFTEMLVNIAAKYNGGLNSANIASAQAGVITMLGFNPLTTKPLMVNGAAAAASNDAAEKLQSIGLAALSKLANDSNNSLGCAGSVSEKVACVVAKSVGVAEIKNGSLTIPLEVQTTLRDAAEKVAANPNLNKTNLSSLQGLASFSQANISVGTPEPAALPAAKAMFASLRTNLNATELIMKSDSDSSPLNKMQAEFAKAISPFDRDLQERVDLAQRATNMIRAYVAAGNKGSRSINYPDGTFCQLSVFNTGNKAPKQAYCSSPYHDSAAMLLDFTPPSQPMTHVMRRQTFNDVAVKPVNDSVTNFTYDSGLNIIQHYYNLNNFGQEVDVYDDGESARALWESSKVAGTITFSELNGQYNTMAINGDLPGNIDEFGKRISEKSTLHLSYTRTADSNTNLTSFALTGDISTFAKDQSGNLQSLGKLEIGSGSEIKVALDAIGVPQLGKAQALKLIVNASTSNSKLSGNLQFDGFVCDKTKISCVPSGISFTGSLSFAEKEFFNGVLKLKVSGMDQFDSREPESPSNFIAKSGSFVGVLRLANRPDLKLSIAASNPVHNQLSATAQYEDGTNTLLLNVERDVNQRSIVTITSASGVTTQFKSDIDASDVYKNGIKVASLNRKTGIITYSDASFESLN